jgi:serine/threonine protein phosphatase PrpC
METNPASAISSLYAEREKASYNILDNASFSDKKHGFSPPQGFSRCGVSHDWSFSRMGIVPSNTAQGVSPPEQPSIIAKLKNVLSKGNKSKHVRPYAAQRTDVGLKRNHNEDSVAYIIPKDPAILAKKGALFLVADGMGGHAAGEVASEMAVSAISTLYYQDDDDNASASLIRSIKYTNTIIFQKAMENVEHNGMGTTCVVAVLLSCTAYIANVGDSRAYLIHRGQIRQITQDHSWVAQQVRAGTMSAAEARTHEMRNMITRSLGSLPEVEVDLFSEQVEEGDTLVLCSDGLSGLVNNLEILQIVERYPPQECVYRLIERANACGGNDNITAIVIRISSHCPELKHL